MKRLLKFVIGLVVIAYLIVIIKAFFTDPAQETRFSPRDSLDVIIHAGREGIAPSDTLYALQMASNMGVDVLEMNIHGSVDGHLVLIHDDTVDRTTNGSGKVSDKTAAELLSLDAAYYYSPEPDFSNIRDFDKRKKVRNPDIIYPLRGQGIRIPLLKAVFESFPTKRMIIEIKQKTPAIAVQFCHMIQSYGRQADIVVGSFHQQVMNEFREACPEVATSMTPREGMIFFLGSKILLTRALSPKAAVLQFPPTIGLPGDFGFLGEIDVVDARLVKEAHRKNMSVQVWTVNESEEMEHLINMGVDGIMTDYPQRLMNVLNKK